ncbi:MAG: amidophosphoribosyltransferase [Candidatus Verstraetearchaeota archaeon]|nr:amidophosphoribosyltransferase [Candidatus Verstraetearchaeota archaeon]
MVGERCGVFGAKCFDGSDAFVNLYWGLVAQNHRGHESYGFLTHSEGLRRYVDLGLVPRIERQEFLRWNILLPGNVGIAHVRYGTSGHRDVYAHLKDAQPIVVSRGKEKLGLAYNGNLVNIGWLKEFVAKRNGRLKTTSDTELLSRYLLDNLDRGIIDSVKLCMEDVEGAFSVVGLRSSGEFFAFRDPLGMRPLCLGQSRDGSIKAVSSETVGLDINDFQVLSEVEPGEALIFTKDGMERQRLVRNGGRAFCGFEFSYFARPDSMINGKYVYRVREEFGRNLGRRYQDVVRDSDLIISIPETADDAAYGLHEETGLRWERTLRRHRFVTHRAFILEVDERTSTIDRKINVPDGGLKGKRAIVVEDSIVRGDTTRTTVKKLREAGAEKVYLFVTFPRITHPCFYGIDMATFTELIGFYFNEEGIAKEIGADAVCYQPLEDFVKATGMRKEDLCMACTTGSYPTELAQRIADKVRSTVDKSDRSRVYERPNLEV